MAKLKSVTSEADPRVLPLHAWLQNLTWQIEFTMRLGGRRRKDGANDWRWFERATSFRLRAIKRPLRPLLNLIGMRHGALLTLDWLHANAEKLWETRCMLVDDLSQLLFDSSLILRITNHRQYYFPRLDFEDLIEVRDTHLFAMNDLPRDYLGLPLLVSNLTLHMPHANPVDLHVILSKGTVDALNSYRQYMVTREGECLAPRQGEIVLDCGACIGDISVLFSAMVGSSGQVHAFDPLPLHNRYCELQATLNPTLSQIMHFNALAVAANSSKATQTQKSNKSITPGLRVDSDSFDCISLDDYVADQQLSRVDFIKMDIEGAEMAALEGARNTIQRFTPRLAISGYHKPEDLWSIPGKIKALNPNYKLYFCHHSPVQWESVFYAVVT